MISTTLSEAVLSKYLAPYFFETGTADGCAVELALRLGFEKVFTVEINPELHARNSLRFKQHIDEGRLHMFLGDTLFVMPQVIEQLIDKRCTFWLDAHVDHGPSGVLRCPLLLELECIKKKAMLKHNILIDDRRMFGKWWGEGISEELVVRKILEIDNDYLFKAEDGYVPNDIIAAWLPT
jgi:hypothetical protein